MERIIEALKTPPEGRSDLCFPSDHATSRATQLLTCLWKVNIIYWRSPDYNAVRFSYTLMVSLLVGGVYCGLGSFHSTQQEVGAAHSTLLLLDC